MTDTSTDAAVRGRPHNGRPLALIKRLRGDGVTVVDTVSHEALGTVGTGRQPHGVAIHPSGRWAYVPYMGSGTIEVIDLAGRSVAATFDSATAPVSASVSRDGERLLVGTYGPMTADTAPGLLVFEPDTVRGDLQVVDAIELGVCAGIVTDVTDDVWVALKQDDTVVRVSGDDYAVRERIAVADGPQGLRYAPEYDLVGADCVEGDAVTFIDTQTGTVIERVDAPNPRSGAVVAEHDQWFVSDTDGDGLTAIRLDTLGGRAVTQRVPLGTPTTFTDATPDGSLVVADAEADDRVTFLDPDSAAVVARPRTGERPHHPRFTTDGRTCYVPNAGADTVTVMDVTGAPSSVEQVTEIAVPEGTAPSGCYFTDRRATP